MLLYGQPRRMTYHSASSADSRKAIFCIQTLLSSPPIPSRLHVNDDTSDAIAK
jgi:hypothetical protein